MPDIDILWLDIDILRLDVDISGPKWSKGSKVVQNGPEWSKVAHYIHISRLLQNYIFAPWSAFHSTVNQCILNSYAMIIHYHYVGSPKF